MAVINIYLERLTVSECVFTANLATGFSLENPGAPNTVLVTALLRVEDCLINNDGAVFSIIAATKVTKISHLICNLNNTSGNNTWPMTGCTGQVDVTEINFQNSISVNQPVFWSIEGSTAELSLVFFNKVIATASMSLIQSNAIETLISNFDLTNFDNSLGVTTNVLSGTSKYSILNIECGANIGPGVFNAFGAGVDINFVGNYSFTTGITINGAVLPNLDTVTSSEPAVVTPPVSGTIYQNTFNTPITLYLAATYNALAAIATMAVALGPGAAPPVIFTESEPATSLNGIAKSTTINVPAGWYYSFTAVNAVLNSLHAVTR